MPLPFPVAALPHWAVPPTLPDPPGTRLWCLPCAFARLTDPAAALRTAVTMVGGHPVCWEHLAHLAPLMTY